MGVFVPGSGCILAQHAPILTSYIKKNDFTLIIFKRNTMQTYFGCHASRDAKKGFVGTLEKALQLGANTVQVMVGNPYGKMNEKCENCYYREASNVKNALTELDMKIFIHSPYYLNFAKDPSAEEPYWIDALWKELQIGEALGSTGSVLHMGKSVKLDVVDAENHFYNNLSQVLTRMADANMTTKLFIETSAGQGTELYPTLNNTLDPLARFFSRFTTHQKKHIGLCVDTCHIFAAGYDISTPEQVKKFFEEWEDKIGLEHMGVVHINNSVRKLGSRVDRHAMLHFGEIPVEGLREFACMSAKHNIPLVLETPSADRDIPVLASMLFEDTVCKNENCLGKKLHMLDDN